MTTPRWPTSASRPTATASSSSTPTSSPRRTPPTRPLVASKFTSGTVDGFAARVADHRRQGERQVHRHDHRRHHRPHLGDQGAPGQHRQLGHTPRAASYDAPEPVHRPRDGDEPDEQPVELARRTDQVPIRIIVKAKEGKNMMMTDARAAYMDASVATADPSRLLVMLCDRLVLDVQRALGAQVAGHHETAHHQLVHAQAIVTELRVSLDPDRLPGWRRARRPLRLPLPAADPRQHPPRLSGDRGVPADRHPGRRHLARGRPLARPYGGARMNHPTPFLSPASLLQATPRGPR